MKDDVTLWILFRNFYFSYI